MYQVLLQVLSRKQNSKTILEKFSIIRFLRYRELRKKNYLVDITENYTLEISENSMSYFAMIAPISEMMEGVKYRRHGKCIYVIFEVEFWNKRDKGYFELLGYNKEHKIERIFRFNINSFKNNYRIHDLTKMT